MLCTTNGRSFPEPRGAEPPSSSARDVCRVPSEGQRRGARLLASPGQSLLTDRRNPRATIRTPERQRRCSCVSPLHKGTYLSRPVGRCRSAERRQHRDGGTDRCDGGGHQSLAGYGPFPRPTSPGECDANTPRGSVRCAVTFCAMDVLGSFWVPGLSQRPRIHRLPWVGGRRNPRPPQPSLTYCHVPGSLAPTTTPPSLFSVSPASRRHRRTQPCARH